MAKKPKTKSSGGTDVGGVDLADVERLLAFMGKHGLEEFEYARGGVHIRLKKPSSVPAHPVVMAAEPALHPSVHAAAGGRARAPEPPVGADLHVIKSPIVGTFYSAPSPGSDPFVTAGARVESGQVLCIIEAMKLMNNIESDVAGKVLEILVQNGQAVEYNMPLFLIDPA